MRESTATTLSSLVVLFVFLLCLTALPFEVLQSPLDFYCSFECYHKESLHQSPKSFCSLRQFLLFCWHFIFHQKPTMKTSHALFVASSLLLLGETEGFSPAHGVSKHRGMSSSRNTVNLDDNLSRSRLFLRAITNPKQELLNNRHSASDWLYNVKSLPQSEVLREIRNPVLSVFGWACFVSVVQHFLIRSKRGLWRTIATKMCIPGTAHSFLVSALGLLLVFRTNSAYQRFNVRTKHV